MYCAYDVVIVLVPFSVIQFLARNFNEGMGLVEEWI